MLVLDAVEYQFVILCSNIEIIQTKAKLKEFPLTVTIIAKLQEGFESRKNGQPSTEAPGSKRNHRINHAKKPLYYTYIC